MRPLDEDMLPKTNAMARQAEATGRAIEQPSEGTVSLLPKTRTVELDRESKEVPKKSQSKQLQPSVSSTASAQPVIDAPLVRPPPASPMNGKTTDPDSKKSSPAEVPVGTVESSVSASTNPSNELYNTSIRHGFAVEYESDQYLNLLADVSDFLFRALSLPLFF